MAAMPNFGNIFLTGAFLPKMTSNIFLYFIKKSLYKYREHDIITNWQSRPRYYFTAVLRIL